jgi:hypothetical protein
LDIKDSLKEDVRLFALGLLLLGVCFGAFALRLLLLAFGFFGMGGFWKGKELLKGK